MAAAGLIVEGLFSVAGLIPNHPRSATIVATRFQWNYTTFLNVAFLAVLALLYWLYRNRERLGGGIGYALDPVCGMQVRTADAPAQSSYDGQRFWFCSDHCRDRFDSEPARYQHPDRAAAVEDVGDTTDPVCGMTVDAGSALESRLHDGRNYSFCGKGCAEAFDADPGRYATGPVASAET